MLWIEGGSTMRLQRDQEPGDSTGEPSTNHRACSGPQVDTLLDALYGLQEPWRARFLTLIRNLYSGVEGNGRLPARDEVRTWLLEDVSLRIKVRQLLETWTQTQV